MQGAASSPHLYDKMQRENPMSRMATSVSPCSKASQLLTALSQDPQVRGHHCLASICSTLICRPVNAPVSDVGCAVRAGEASSDTLCICMAVIQHSRHPKCWSAQEDAESGFERHRASLQVPISPHYLVASARCVRMLMACVQSSGMPSVCQGNGRGEICTAQPALPCQLQPQRRDDVEIWQIWQIIAGTQQHAGE